jgi:hypothetical protein
MRSFTHQMYSASKYLICIEMLVFENSFSSGPGKKFSRAQLEQCMVE